MFIINIFWSLHSCLNGIAADVEVDITTIVAGGVGVGVDVGICGETIYCRRWW